MLLAKQLGTSQRMHECQNANIARQLKSPLLFLQLSTNLRTELVTQLYFENNVPPSFEDRVKGRKTQFPQQVTATEKGRDVRFDIVF